MAVIVASSSAEAKYVVEIESTHDAYGITRREQDIIDDDDRVGGPSTNSGSWCW